MKQSKEHRPPLLSYATAIVDIKSMDHHHGQLRIFAKILEEACVSLVCSVAHWIIRAKPTVHGMGHDLMSEAHFSFR